MTTNQLNQPNQLLYGKDGRVYVKKTIGPVDRPQFTAILPAREVDIPEPRVAGPSLELGAGFTKIPLRTMLFVHAYFKEIYDRFKAEAIVFFHKEPESEEYLVLVPESFSATAASLTYEHSQPKFCTLCRICSTNAEITECPRCGTDTMRATNIYGTAHSHGSMSAFHSGTDDEHEKGQTGFHITFGNVDKGLFSVCPSFVTALLGYTVDGKGIRHYPSLEELVELPSPLTQADRQMMTVWLSTILNEDIVRRLSKDSVVVIENKKTIVFHGPNSSVAERWIAAQGSRRELAAHPISALELNRRTTSARSFKNGAIITQRQAERQRIATPMGRTGITRPPGNIPQAITQVWEHMRHTTGTATPQTQKTSPETDQKNTTTGTLGSETTGGSSINVSLSAEKVWDIGRFTITVDHEYDGTTVDIGNTDYLPWPMLQSDQPAEYRALQVWEVIFILQQISSLIGDVVPKKTGGIDTEIDTALKALATRIDHWVGTGTAAESIVDGFTDDGKDIIEVVQNSIKCVMREIEGAQYNTEQPSSILKSIGSLFLILFLVEDTLFWAGKHKVLNTDIVDDLEEQCNAVGTALLKQHTKEIDDMNGVAE